MPHAARLAAATALALALALAACTGIRTHKAYAIDDLTDMAKHGAAVQDAAGWAGLNGVPTLAERLRKRPGVQLAVLQMVVNMQGDCPECREPTHDWPGAISGRRPYHPTAEALPRYTVPADLGTAIANRACQNLEQSLERKGYKVIGADRVAATRAYLNLADMNASFAHVPQYQAFPNDMPWTRFAPRGLRAIPGRSPDDVRYAILWIKPEELRAIEQELGGDVLFLCVSSALTTQETTHKPEGDTKRWVFGCDAIMTIADPDFVGTRLAPEGHYVGYSDVHLTSRSRGAFVRQEGTGIAVNWPSLWRDASTAHAFAFEAMAEALVAVAPPTMLP